MENASKALIMAASMLMGMMIISIAVYLFVTFGKVASDTYEQIDTDRLNQFNSQFTSYVERSYIDTEKGYITIYDVISLANLATENNKKYEFDRRVSSAVPTNAKMAKDNYIFVFVDRTAEGRKTNTNIEFGFSDTTKDINIKNNEIIKSELKKIGSGHETLPTYKCECFISEITR